MPAHPKVSWDVELTRCMRGGFGQFTPVNFGTCVLFNNSTAGEILVVWSAYLWPNLLGDAGFAVFNGNPGGKKSYSLWTRMAPVAGVVTQLDTATAYALDQNFPSGMTPANTIAVDMPWAILDPGWSFIIQSQKAANEMSASIIWQSVVDLTK